MAKQADELDLAIVGGGIAGVVALTYARRAGLKAIAFEKQGRVGGLWRDLPAWQDIQIGLADWGLGDLPLAGPAQPQVLANIEAWVDRFDLADGIRLNCPVETARETESGWELLTPQGIVRARHLLAATGAHNQPVIPAIDRSDSRVREFHSSALHDATLLTGRDVVVVGGGASAYDLLDLCFAHQARHVIWVYRGLRWFVPTRKPKIVAGSLRDFARLQVSGMPLSQQIAALQADMRGRYEKFGLTDILPSHEFDLARDQVIPGRPGMLANFPAIERHRGTVVEISGRDVILADGQRIEADLLLWGTGYRVDLGYFERPEIAAIQTVVDLATRCGGLVCSRDAKNLYFPGVGLDGVGSAPWFYALVCRSIMSHIRGTARLGDDAVDRRLHHFDIVNLLAPRDPGSFAPESWRAQYRDLAISSPDDQPYPLP